MSSKVGGLYATAFEHNVIYFRLLLYVHRDRIEPIQSLRRLAATLVSGGGSLLRPKFPGFHKPFLSRFRPAAPILRRSPPPYGRRRTDGEPNRGWGPALALALSIGIVDWATKAWIAGRIPLGDLVEVVDGRVAFWHVRNPALVLGLFGDRSMANRVAIAVLLAIGAVILIVEVLSRSQRLLPRRRPWAWLFVGLLFGGMLGNLGERALHWWVTDYLSFRWGTVWLPPGNVADLAILASIPVALLVIGFEIEARAKRRTDERAPID